MLSLKPSICNSDVDVLLCASCSFTSARCDPFNSISIDIPFDAPTDQSQPSAVYQLQNLIANHLQHEVLDDDNKWRCQQCNQCVAAHKYVQYESLPPTLVIHLKRFRFDPVSEHI
jgi:ubiquitin C-terminal hydrolase